MSKALPIAVAVLLGGAALVPVYYATQNPAAQTQKHLKMPLLFLKLAMHSVMKLLIKLHLSWILTAL